jgi:hypothetical protein
MNSELRAVWLCLALTGCASDPLQDGFKGETAVLQDSYAGYESGGLLGPARARFFVATKIDGKYIPNAVDETDHANEGRGFAMTPVPYERRVPIKPMKVQLFAQVYYAAPIASILSKTYDTRKEVSFTPEPGARYVVRGKLGDEGSDVWIEKEDGGVVAK